MGHGYIIEHQSDRQNRTRHGGGQLGQKIPLNIITKNDFILILVLMV